MKPFLLIGALLVLSLANNGFAGDVNYIESEFMILDGVPFPTTCEKNQSTVNACVIGLWRAADKELNSLFQAQIQYLSDSEARWKTDGMAKKQLVAAQKAWIAFRDKDCAYQVGDETGSSAPYEEHKCKYKRTVTRIVELKEYLACRYNGCPF